MSPFDAAGLLARHRERDNADQLLELVLADLPDLHALRLQCAQHTYGGDLVSTWSVLRQSCKPRSPVGLVNPPGKEQMRRTISQSLPR